MMKFDDLVARVAARRLVAGKDTFVRVCCEAGEMELDIHAFTLAVVQELGLHVGRDGCVHDPKPAQVHSPQMPNVRYRGQARGRGRR